MPKVLALFFGGDSSDEGIAQAAAEGARSVRFVEADVRTGGPGQSTHKRVASAHAVSHYDGVVLVAATSATGAELDRLLTDLQREPGVENLVFGLAGAQPSLLERVVRLGAILVTVPETSGPVISSTETASILGARVAHVAGWVRHALGHEAEHQHSH